MTEAEWLACGDAHPMLELVRDRATDRKYALAAVQASRQLWEAFPVHALGVAVTVCDRWADGRGKPGELFRVIRVLVNRFASFEVKGADHLTEKGQAIRSIMWLLNGIDDHIRGRPLDTCEWARGVIPDYESKYADLVRDLFGNPFRPATLDPNWLTPTVIALAAGMYESRDFSAMPILADALQDAGCENEDIQNHCRGNGPHVRGCWVVDLVLGKE